MRVAIQSGKVIVTVIVHYCNYGRIIQNVYTHFQMELHAKDHRIPLMINTCGWLNCTVM